MLILILKYLGNDGESSPRELKNPERPCFQKNATDTFLFSSPYSLGSLKEIEIWHNNSGDSPGWYLMQVQVRSY